MLESAIPHLLACSNKEVPFILQNWVGAKPVRHSRSTIESWLALADMEVVVSAGSSSWSSHPASSAENSFSWSDPGDSGKIIVVLSWDSNEHRRAGRIGGLATISFDWGSGNFSEWGLAAWWNPLSVSQVPWLDSIKVQSIKKTDCTWSRHLVSNWLSISLLRGGWGVPLERIRRIPLQIAISMVDRAMLCMVLLLLKMYCMQEGENAATKERTAAKSSSVLLRVSSKLLKLNIW